MSEVTLQAQTDAANAYEAVMVPALFQEWAQHVLDVAGLKPGQRVLDVACGTGVLAREAAQRLGASSEVVGLDPNPGMLSVAGRLDPLVDWRSGTAEAIPFPDASFDAVVSQFGMMFFQDRRGAIREMLRVLKPGGALTVAVWDTIENSPAYSIEAAILERVAGQAAADALRAPFVLGDPSELAELLKQGEASSPTVSSKTGIARFPSVRIMVEADLRGWLPVMDVTLSEQQIDQILSEAERELAKFSAQDGEVVFDSPAHIATVRKLN